MRCIRRTNEGALFDFFAALAIHDHVERSAVVSAAQKVEESSLHTLTTSFRLSLPQRLLGFAMLAFGSGAARMPRRLRRQNAAPSNIAGSIPSSSRQEHPVSHRPCTSPA